jgi:hypothetical protein
MTEIKEYRAMVEKNGYALADVPTALRTETLCLAAVQQQSWVLRYVPFGLRAVVQRRLMEATE